MLTSAIQIENVFDRAAADEAERHPVPAEHDAILLRTVVSLSLVVGALERADLPGIRPARKQRRRVRVDFAKQRVHFRFGSPGLAKRTSPAL